MKRLLYSAVMLLVAAASTMAQDFSFNQRLMRVILKEGILSEDVAIDLPVSYISEVQWIEGAVSVEEHSVDLGLSVLWADKNVGADSPEDNGDYYAWGEKKTKDCYDWSTYRWCEGTEYTMTKYCTRSYYGKVDENTTLSLGDVYLKSDDIARYQWIENWRMPTEDEMEELVSKCIWTWTKKGGKRGYQVTGPSGKSIFLPAAGFYEGEGNLGDGSKGYYWTSSLNTSYNNGAPGLYFDAANTFVSSRFRNQGLTIRPVADIPIEVVKINEEKLDMKTGETCTLTTSIYPSHAGTGRLVWYSTNNSVAKVSQTGVVEAVGYGTCLIQCKDKDMKYFPAACTVSVTPDQATDLGLSVMWSDKNLGAEKPEDTGWFLSWGETAEKPGDNKYYDWSTYIWYDSRDGNSKSKITKYKNQDDRYDTSRGTTPDYMKYLDYTDDAAYMSLHAGWRIPTDAEFEELIKDCTWEWTTRNGVNGYEVTGPSGNSIFLPAAGGKIYDEHRNYGENGFYWSNHTDSNTDAYHLNFDFIKSEVSSEVRIVGLPIRPVFYYVY